MQYNFYFPMQKGDLSDQREMLFSIVNLSIWFVFSLAFVIAISFWKRYKQRHLDQLVAAKIESHEYIMRLVSSELHANYNQMASLINISLAEILHQYPSDAFENIVVTKTLAKQLLSGLNAFSQSLNSGHVLQTGFADALRHELGRVADTRKTQVTFCREGQEYRIKPDDEIILFRLCQEIFHSLLHTSKVFSINVTLTYAPQYMDVGIVYSKTGEAEPDRNWLSGIKERARYINASVHNGIRSGKQTHFYLRVAHTSL